MSMEAGPADSPGDDSPLLTAARLIEWRRASGEPPLTGIQKAAVLTHQRSLLPPRPRWLGWRSASAGAFEARRLRAPYQDVTIIACGGVGGPATSVTIEELAAAGVRRLVALDVAGSIDPEVASGDVVIVEGALTADGTSRHYTGDSVVVPASALTAALAGALARAAVPFSMGTVWSTDAVFRETPKLISAQRAKGAALVDMETATTLAVSAATGIEAAVILVAADEIRTTWRPPPDPALVQARLRALLPLAASCLRE